MANTFDFGIGITASDEGASDTIRGVITQLGDLENSMTSIAGGVTLKDVMGFDLGALLPATDILDSIKGSLMHMSETLQIISEDTGRMSGAFGSAAAPIDAATASADKLGMEVCGVVVCAENVDAALKAAAASADGLDKSMSKIPAKAETTSDLFGRVADASALLQNNGSKLRQAMTRVHGSIGATAEQSDLLASSVLTLAKDTKVSVEQVAALNTHLAGAAIGMGDLKGPTEENMKTMVLLNETFGMSHGEVQRLAGTMKLTGNSLVDLTGTAVKFQKDFNVPGLINTLPAAAEAAIDAQNRFGSATRTSSKDITVSIMKMTGIYSKALGVTAVQAANKARNNFMKFTAEIESYEDIFLGLADDFTPLQKSLLETGISMEDMEDLMHKAKDAPQEFAAEVFKIRDSMDPQMGERFFRQMQRNAGEGVQPFLAQKDAIDNVNKSLAEGAGEEPSDPSKTFKAIADAMRANAVDANRMHEALMGVGTELTKLAADEGVRRGLEDVNKGLQVVVGGSIDAFKQVRLNEEAFEDYTQVIRGTTAAMVALNDAHRAFSAAAGGISTIFLGATAAALLLLKPIMWVGKAIWNLIKKIDFKDALSRTKGRIGNFFSGIRSSASRAWNWISQTAGKAGTRISEAFRGAGQSVSRFGTRTMDAFRSAKSYIGKTVSNIGTRISTAFQSAGKTISNFGSRTMDAFRSAKSYIGKTVSNIGTRVSEAFRSAGRSISNFGSRAVEAFRNTKSYIGKAISNIGTRTAEIFRGIGSRVMSALQGAGKLIRGFGSGVMDAFRGAGNFIGKVFSGIGGRIMDALQGAGKFIRGFGSGVMNAFRGAGSFIGKIFSGLGGRIMGVFQGVGSFIGKTVGSIGGVFSGLFGRITGMFGGGGGGVAGLLGKAGGAFKVLGKIIGKLAWPITAVIAAYEGVKEAFSTGDIMAGLWKAVDSFFMGIPDIFVRGFTRARDRGEGILMSIGVGFQNLGNTITGAIGSALTWVIEKFGETSDGAKTIVDSLGTIITTTFGYAMDSVYGAWLTTKEGFLAGFDAITEGWLVVKHGFQLGAAYISDAMGTMIDAVQLVFYKGLDSIAKKVQTFLADLIYMAWDIVEEIPGMGDEAAALGEAYYAARDANVGFSEQIAEIENRAASGTTAVAAATAAIEKETREHEAASVGRLAAIADERRAIEDRQAARAQTMGKAVDTLLGADPNADANAARQRANDAELAQLRAARGGPTAGGEVARSATPQAQNMGEAAPTRNAAPATPMARAIEPGSVAARARETAGGPAVAPAAVAASARETQGGAASGAGPGTTGAAQQQQLPPLSVVVRPGAGLNQVAGVIAENLDVELANQSSQGYGSR